MSVAHSNYDVSPDTIFVSDLPLDATEEQLKDYFGQIGVIKFDKKNQCPKIWIYKDKTTGKSKGEATITYDDPPTATAAITWFNGKEFRGHALKIELAQRRSAPQFGNRGGHGGGRDNRGGGGGYRGGGDNRGPRGGGYDRGDRQDRAERGDRGDRGDIRNNRGDRDDRRRSGGPMSGRPGDWACPNPTCNNNNFAYRRECNRCHTQKPSEPRFARSNARAERKFR